MIGKTISHYPALRDPEQRDKILAKGGMGVVYKAEDTKLERFVTNFLLLRTNLFILFSKMNVRDLIVN